MRAKQAARGVSFRPPLPQRRTSIPSERLKGLLLKQRVHIGWLIEGAFKITGEDGVDFFLSHFPPNVIEETLWYVEGWSFKLDEDLSTSKEEE